MYAIACRVCNGFVVEQITDLEAGVAQNEKGLSRFQVGRADASYRDDRQRHAYGIVSCRGGMVSVFGTITVMTPS